MLTVRSETPQKIELSIKILNEMPLLKNGTVRDYDLELVYQYLLMKSPTSIEAKRTFSAADSIANKNRSRHGDNTLDALVFLRSYF